MGEHRLLEGVQSRSVSRHPQGLDRRDTSLEERSPGRRPRHPTYRGTSLRVGRRDLLLRRARANRRERGVHPRDERDAPDAEAGRPPRGGRAEREVRDRAPGPDGYTEVHARDIFVFREREAGALSLWLRLRIPPVVRNPYPRERPAHPHRYHEEIAMETISLTTMPISTNQLYLGHKILTKKARENKRSIAWEASLQFRRPLFEGPIRVYVRMFWKDARNHDLDNIKALLDALTTVVWLDDKQLVELHLTKAIDKERPRCEIEIYDA